MHTHAHTCIYMHTLASLLGAGRGEKYDSSREMMQMAALASLPAPVRDALIDMPLSALQPFLGGCSRATLERAAGSHGSYPGDWRECAVLPILSVRTLFAFAPTCKALVSCSIGKHLVMLSPGFRRVWSVPDLRAIAKCCALHYVDSAL